MLKQLPAAESTTRDLLPGAAQSATATLLPNPTGADLPTQGATAAALLQCMVSRAITCSNPPLLRAATVALVLWCCFLFTYLPCTCVSREVSFVRGPSLATGASLSSGPHESWHVVLSMPRNVLATCRSTRATHVGTDDDQLRMRVMYVTYLQLASHAKQHSYTHRAAAMRSPSPLRPMALQSPSQPRTC